MTKLINTDELAEILGVHPNWIYQQAAAGTIPSYQVGRLRRFELHQVLESLTNADAA